MISLYEEIQKYSFCDNENGALKDAADQSTDLVSSSSEIRFP